MRYCYYLIFVFILNACTFGVPVGSVQTPKEGATTSKTKSTTQKNTGSGYKKPKSYVVFGKRYHVLNSSAGYVEKGIASWYGSKFHGRKTANGETYDMYAMTAAHKTLPLPTTVSVKNLSNGRTIIVRINDRGPFVDGRIIDLSYAAAKELGIDIKGTESVEVRAINSATKSPTKNIKSGQKTYYIQTGYFGVKKNADTQVNKLKKAGFNDARRYSVSNDKGQFYRVRVGPYHDLNYAQDIKQNLGEAWFEQLSLITEN